MCFVCDIIENNGNSPAFAPKCAVDDVAVLGLTNVLA